MLIYHRLSKEILIAITDEPEKAKQLEANKQPVIGILSPKSVTSDWSGVSYLSEDISLFSYISEDNEFYCKEVCHRILGIPVVIGQFCVGQSTYVIREMIEEDVNELYELYKEDSWSHFLEPLNEDKKIELEKIKKYISHSYPIYRCGIWSIVKEEYEQNRLKKQLVGRVGLEYKEYGDFYGCFLGYALKQSEGGRGVGTRACEIALCYGKKELGEEKIYAYIHKGNEPSIKMAKRLEMKQVGSDGNHWIFCG